MNKAKGKDVRKDNTGQKEGRLLKRPAVVAWLLFAGLIVLYQANGDFLVGNDSKPNVFMAVNLIEKGSLSFTPTEMPFMFIWTVQTQQGPRQVDFARWDEKFENYSFSELNEAGVLKLIRQKYYLVPSVRTDANGMPLYVSTFGPGAGFCALPVMAALHLACGNLVDHPSVLWYGAKFAASIMVAGSAVFVFLTAAGFTTVRRSALIAIVYGAGTCVWSVSSQALWQHGPNEFFLAMGTYFISRLARGGNWRQAAYAGAAYSAAVACRPTSIIVVAAVGAYLLIVNRRFLLPYLLACLPIGVALGAYNTYYLGAPYEFGQGKAGQRIAEEKTGSEDLWQTPLWLGAAGLMVSPARGLLVYSPFMAFAFAGLILAWRRRQYAFLRPLTIAMAAMLIIAFKWFDWWGGWCFGYRPIVDTMPIFALLLVPVIDWICSRKAVLAVFLVLAAWSVGVQVIGSWSYNILGWNNRIVGYKVYLQSDRSPVIVDNWAEVMRIKASYQVGNVEMLDVDIDKPENRRRLWSLTDTPLIYYVKNFSAGRDAKHREMDIWLSALYA